MPRAAAREAAAEQPRTEGSAAAGLLHCARARGAGSGPAADHGEACLVWFQDDVTTTIAPDVADALGRLVWGEIAIDVYW